MKEIRQPAESQTAKRCRYQHHPVGLQLATVERMRLGANVSALAEELGVDRTLLYLWKKRGAPKRERDSESEADFDQREQQIRELQAKIAELEGELGRAGLEVRFFKGALRKIEASRQRQEETGATASTPKSAARRQRKAG
jgi:TolA-binding protein